MTIEDYNHYAVKFEQNCTHILANRTNQYQTITDPLYNFEIGAELNGNETYQTCWGYMTKHLAALRKKVIEKDLSDPDDWLEKCTDVANYAKLLYMCAMSKRDELENAECCSCPDTSEE